MLARRLSGWSPSLKSWQEPIPFGMHTGSQEGREGLQCSRGVPVRLPATWKGHQAAGGVMDMAQDG